MEKFEVNDLFNPQIINMSSRKQPMTSETEEPEAPKTNKEKMKAFLLLRRTRIATGVIIGLFGVFLLLSCISFFYTGAADQSEVVNTAFVDQEASAIENQGAIFGAYLAHIFVERGVGLAAFIIVLWCAVISIRLLRDTKVFFLHFTFLSLLSIFTFSMVVGGITYNMNITFFPLGGNIGYYLNNLLYEYSAIYGMVMVDAVIAMIWVFVFYKMLYKIYSYTSDKLKSTRSIRKMKKVEQEEESETAPLTDFMGDSAEDNHDIESEQSQPAQHTAYQPLRREPIVVPPIVEEDPVEDDNSGSEDEKPAPEEPVETITINVDGELPTEDSKTEEMVIKESGEIEKAKVLNQELYDPTKELSKFKQPTIDLMKDYGSSKITIDVQEQEANKDLITRTLLNYQIEINRIEVTVGPTITLFEIVPKEGVRIQRIKGLEDDIALCLAAKGIRIIAPMPGKGTVGIEVPNKEPQIVSMRSVLESKAFQESKAALPMALGCNVSNEVVVADMAKMPHLLVAGATGQGKSVGLNAIITSMLYKKHPAELKFVLIDPKMVEFSIYSRIEHHYLAKLPGEEKAIITEAEKVVPTLNSLVEEMEDRYRLLEKASERNIKDYNARFVKHELNPNNGHRFLPYIVLIIDEFCDLIMQSGKEIETPLVRLAQKARAIGIHVILATQRPDAKTITGLIKANFPSRIAFRVSQMQDSRTIIDVSGAQHLIGKGDMLFSADGEITRLQCAFVDTPEVNRVCTYIGDQIGYSEAYALPEPPASAGDDFMTPDGPRNSFDRDPLFEEALEFIAQSDYASTSSLQRRFGIGYNRAGRIMDQIEAAGIVSASQGGKPRKVLMTPSEIDMYLNK